MVTKFIICILIIVNLIGCSSMNKSILLVTTIGGAGGASIGHNFGDGDNAKRNNGALIGAAIGGLFGYLIHKEQNKEKKILSKNIEEQVPLLTRPKVRKIWVKDEVKGKRFVRGHWEYVLEENSEWSR